MENIFIGMKEKIKFYEELLSKNNISKDTSNIIKIEKEIEEFKNKITELNKDMENKTKIEKMKISLNITSIESEISLKEIELDEERKKAEAEQQKEIQDYNNELEASKEKLIAFIKSSETSIENAVKGNEANIILNKDFEEIKGYYQNIMNVEKSTLNNIEKERNNLDKIMSSKDKEAKSIKEEADRYFNEGTYWAKQKPFTIFGNFDDDKAEEYQDNMNEAFRMSENLHKKVATIKKEIEPQKKEMEKLNIKKDAAIKKIENIDLMIDEMIKELIKEEETKNEIIFPSFVPNGKYFNSSKEEI